MRIGAVVNIFLSLLKAVDAWEVKRNPSSLDSFLMRAVSGAVISE